MTCTDWLMLVLVFGIVSVAQASWEEWWTYEGISGPAYWGVLNPNWRLCDRGRRQSPINIDPHSLLFDPLLRPLHIDPITTAGVLNNTGRLLVFRAEQQPGQPPVNISGGPLLYTYQLSEIHVHFGTGDRSGSEHSVNGYTFPAEIQIYGFNSDLYRTPSEAADSPHGVVAIALMVQIGEQKEELSTLTNCLSNVQFKGSRCRIEALSVCHLMPQTDDYITYEGSTTYPGCWETATWILPNRPIYIADDTLRAMRGLVQGSRNRTKGLLGDNRRPLQPAHYRPIRTTVTFDGSGAQVRSGPDRDSGLSPDLGPEPGPQPGVATLLLNTGRVYAHQCSMRCSTKPPGPTDDSDRSTVERQPKALKTTVDAIETDQITSDIAPISPDHRPQIVMAVAVDDTA